MGDVKRLSGTAEECDEAVKHSQVNKYREKLHFIQTDLCTIKVLDY